MQQQQKTNFDKKNEITELCKGVHGVDLGESFPTSIYLQTSASIQPRTSPSKFGGKYSILFNRVLRRGGGLPPLPLRPPGGPRRHAARCKKKEGRSPVELCKGVHCVDLGESFPTSIYLQNLASIQPRTSPVKFASSSSRNFELELRNFEPLICSPGYLRKGSQ